MCMWERKGRRRKAGVRKDCVIYLRRTNLLAQDCEELVEHERRHIILHINICRPIILETNLDRSELLY